MVLSRGYEAQDVARAKLMQVFRYLQALHQLRNPVQREITDQPWLLWFHDVPHHPSVQRGIISGIDQDEPEDEASRRSGEGKDGVNFSNDFLLKVSKPRLTDPPEPPRDITPWLQPGWQSIDGSVDVLRAIDDPTGQTNSSGQRLTLRFDADPRRLELLTQWMVRRDAWAQAERPARKAMALYERLRTLHAQVERESERLELMVGDGLLTWQHQSGQHLHHPVLLLRLQLHYNPNIPEFTLMEAERPPELYTALFRALPDIQPSAIAQAQQDVGQGSWHPLGGEETDGFLRRLVNHLSPYGIFAGDGATRESRQAPTITRDPVLFLRTRTLGFSTALESILEDLPQHAMLPYSLTSIVGIAGEDAHQQAAPPPALLDSPNGEDEEVLLSKPANAEQVEIAHRLERYGAVLVQGPPGTGKTHTIANLLGHLLAQGKSVLVTSHTTKALRVLRDQVVEPLQPLCVSVLDEDSKQMESAVDAITERLASSNAEVLERQAKRHQEERLVLLRQVRTLREQLRDARFDEYRALVVAGEQYAPVQAAKLVAAERERDGWIPVPIMPGAPLPLAEGELIDLYRSNILVTSKDEQELALALPDPRQLPPPSDFERLVAERERLYAADLDYRRDLWSGRRPIQQAPDVLEALYERLQQTIESLKEGNRWQIAALVAGRSGGSYRQAWDDLIAQIERTASISAQAQPVLLTYDLVLPEECLPDKIESVLDAIWGHLKAGNKLGGLRLLTHPDWKTVIESARVNGRQPALPEHFEALRTLVRLRRARAELISRWQRQIVPLDGPDASQLGAEPERTCAQFIPFIRQRLEWYPGVWSPLEQALMQQGFNMIAFLAETPVNLVEYGELLRLRDAVLHRLPAVLAAENNRRLAGLQEAEFIELRRRLELSGGQAAKADVVQGLQAAVEGYNPLLYRAAFESLAGLHTRREILQRRQTLLATLEQVAPSWAAAIRDRSGRHAERDLPGKPEDAWTWRQLSDELDRRAKISLENLQQQIAQLSTQLQRTTAELVEQQAWAAQVRRTTLEQRQALTGWKQIMQRIGKGTGKRVPRLLAEARKLMPLCQSAVPVWIMPLSRVVENFDPRRNRFDVIIIDEASQADLMALTSVYLGRQVIVVGDHEQVSPLAVGQRVEDAQRLIDEHLQGIPNAILYDGQASIYDVAQRSFDPVCLREHFRCVAPIIEFSNRLAYDGKIKPLRDASRVRLRPHTVAYRVAGASSNEKVNEQEALEVASLLVASTEQPEYAGASFGVISLVGDDQAGRIEALLHRHLSESDYQQRRIQCGNAAQFQGDERDVMFLSMVQAPTGGPLSLIDRDRTQYRQRFNVAASRARDQMWLVHSLDPEVDLKPGDLRRRLIEHARDPEAIKHTLEAGEQQTESELEQRVLRRLVQADYRVKTQWPVGAYRLDLVVEGNNKRLAIECDGDRYHTREKLAEDMGRQAILERLGWRFARIRGSEFFRNPDQTMEAIFARLREMDIPPEGGQSTESDIDETAEELKQRIIRRAAELRREWAEQGEEGLSYSGTIAASSRRRWGQPEPTQKPAPATPPTPAAPAAPVQSARPAIVTPISPTPKEPPVSSNLPGSPAVPLANPSSIQSSAKAVGQSKSQKFFPGDIVKHPAFGIGTVLSSSLAAGTEFVRIDFKGQVRIRAVNAETAHLEKVQAGTQVTQPTASNAAATLTDTRGPKQTFAVGDQVRHPIYGTGKLIKGPATFSAAFYDGFVQVDFGGQVGKKILDLQKEPLEKISLTTPASQPKPSVPHEEKPKQEFFASDKVWHPVFGFGTVVRGTIAFQGNAVEVEFGKTVGRKIIDLRETTLAKAKPDRQPSTEPPAPKVPPESPEVSSVPAGPVISAPKTPLTHMLMDIDAALAEQEAAALRKEPSRLTPALLPTPSKGKQFFAGDQVSHPTYGIGKVLGSGLAAGSEFVLIDFGEPVGRKSVDAEASHLQKIHTGMQPAQPHARNTTSSRANAKAARREFFAGDQVKHPIYGVGKVVRGTIAFQDGKFVDIDFGGQLGKKTLEVATAHLEKVRDIKTPGVAQPNKRRSVVSPTKQTELRFSPGDVVKHPIYGTGQVVDSMPTGRFLVVDFGRHVGEKTLGSGVRLEKI